MFVYVHNLSELSHYLYSSYKHELNTLPYACMKFLWDTAREIICSNIMCIIILGKKCAIIFFSPMHWQRFTSLCWIEFWHLYLATSFWSFSYMSCLLCYWALSPPKLLYCLSTWQIWCQEAAVLPQEVTVWNHFHLWELLTTYLSSYKRSA